MVRVANRRNTALSFFLAAAIAVGASVYMHESVTFVYADGGASWLTEDDRTDDGGTAILLATLEGEREAERFTQHGGRGIVLRFGGFYAPDALSTLETIALVRKRMMPQIGTAANYFSSIYVPDAGSAVAAALSAPAGIYNVVDDTPIPFAAYLQTVARAVGARRPFHLPGFVGKWMFGDVWRFFSRSQRVSNARLKYVSGWQPEARSVGEGWRIITAELDARNTKQQPVSQARAGVPHPDPDLLAAFTEQALLPAESLAKTYSDRPSFPVTLSEKMARPAVVGELQEIKAVWHHLDFVHTPEGR